MNTAVKHYLAHFRKSRGLTQEELAEAVGTTQAQIMRLETGKRKLTVEWANRLAVPLFCTTQELLFGPQQSLTTEEQRFIQSYRQLPQDQQTTYLDLMETLATKWKNQSKA